jgi:hypothetical protein
MQQIRNSFYNLTKLPKPAEISNPKLTNIPFSPSCNLNEPVQSCFNQGICTKEAYYNELYCSCNAGFIPSLNCEKEIDSEYGKKITEYYDYSSKIL